MDASPRAITPLRQRMIDDMRMCKLSEKTQLQYIRAVRRLAAFLGRSPDTVTVEDLRRYQLHLVDHGTSPVSINAAITGLKFFFDVTLDRRELITKMRPVRVPRKLPVVLSRDEVARLIAAAGNLKHQTALSAAYGAGLRASEVVALKVTDIDSHRMTLRIEQGKGSKDRYAMLPPILLERLRGWWRVARAQGKMLEGGWLFAGQNPIESLTCRQLNRAVHSAARRWAAMFCVAKLVSRSRSLTTHVAIGIARSVRRAPHGDGSRLDKPICYPSSITTWCSRCQHRSQPSPTPTRP